MRFKVGQLVIGKKDNGYYYTDYRHVCIVRSVGENGFTAEVLSGPSARDVRGITYPVNYDGFILYEDPFEGNV